MAESISGSMEDYLEAICHIIDRQKVARPKDIGKILGVTGPSVTKALHWLADHGLINYAPFELVTLTEAGEQAARDVVRRHEALCDFLVNVLSIEPQRADEEACKMEHSIAPDILERLIQYAEFVQICPRGGTQWIKDFGYRCRTGQGPEDCEHCLEECLRELRSKKQAITSGASNQVALAELSPGMKGCIVEFAGEEAAQERLVEMGADIGAVVEVERSGSDEEPFEVKVRGYHLTLSHDEAALILVTPL